MPRGGFRAGAGRKKNSGQYKESTKAIQVPLSLLADLEAHLLLKKEGKTPPPLFKNSTQIPLYSSLVSAGYPFIGDDHEQEKLDLNDALIQNPSTTFFVRVTGDSMINAGIRDKDLLIVDRSLNAKSGSIVIAAVNGELTVKRLMIKGGKMELHPENPNFPVIVITQDTTIHLWGVVTNVIHQFV